MFWAAFFNPTYFPSLIMRTLACLSLAGIYALITFARVDDPKLVKLRTKMVRWSAQWLVPMVLLMPVVLVWFLAAMPAYSRGVLQLGMTTIGSGAFTQVTRIAMLTVITTLTIAGVAYFMAYKMPKEFSVAHAVALLGLGAVATASTEYARETVRKPYVIGDHMYSNGVRVRDVERLNKEGYLTQSMWVEAKDKVGRGEAMYRGQCASCHTRDGYRSLTTLLQGRDEKNILKLLDMLHKPTPESPYVKYMPPLVGTQDEIDDLGAYLATLSQPQAETTKDGQKLVQK